MELKSLTALAVLLTFLSPANAGIPEGAMPVGYGVNPKLPKPDPSLIPTISIANVVGWPAGKTPVAAPGMKVGAFAKDLAHPRWLYVLPNNDVLVAETDAPPKLGAPTVKGWVTKKFMEKAGSQTGSANRITLLRDSNNDGIVDKRSTFLENLHSPFGMALIGNDFYVANADTILRFPYQPGDLKITHFGKKVVDLPGGMNHHWTKNIIASADGRYLYATVGSNSNIAENGMGQEDKRAAILEVDLAAKRTRIFASGLRNPNGLAWTNQGQTLWTVVNERDQLGNDLVPDYLTSVQKDGFYGWPYSFFGKNVDERVKPQRPDLVAKAVVPDYALGAHTASLGLAISENNSLPAPFQQGAFIGQHGSWNREPLSGYKVVFVPFKSGKPEDKMPMDVLTGFVNDKEEAYGRPVGVAFDNTGVLFVADDVGNTVWRVSAK